MRATSFMTTALAVAAIAAPAAMATPVSTAGTGARICAPGPHADCHGIKARWTFEHHGDLHGIRFRGADLRGADLRGANLSGADLRGAVLHHADLRGASLRGANLRGVRMRHVNLRDVDARGAHFGVTPRRARGSAREMGSPSGFLPDCGTSCQGQDISGTTLEFMDGTGGDFRDTTWDGSDVVHGFFAGANFTGASMTALFEGADFTGANLTDVDASRAAGNRGSFAGADFTNANMSFAHFQDTDMDHSTSPGPAMPAILHNANLYAADFTGAHVAGVVFSSAIFRATTCPNGVTTDTGC